MYNQTRIQRDSRNYGRRAAISASIVSFVPMLEGTVLDYIHGLDPSFASIFASDISLSHSYSMVDTDHPNYIMAHLSACLIRYSTRDELIRLVSAHIADPHRTDDTRIIGRVYEALVPLDLSDFSTVPAPTLSQFSTKPTDCLGFVTLPDLVEPVPLITRLLLRVETPIPDDDFTFLVQLGKIVCETNTYFTSTC